MKMRPSTVLLVVFVVTMGALSVATLAGRPVHHRSLALLQTNYKININTADAAAFGLLSGIGPKLAERIVMYRQSMGGRLDSIEQLNDVRGIGVVTFGRMRDYVTCGLGVVMLGNDDRPATSTTQDSSAPGD